jgi:hypothetical protein
MMPVSPQPPKRRRIANFQAGKESLIIRSGKRKHSRTGNNSYTSHSRADPSSSSSGDFPQLHASPFEFNPSLPLLDTPPASPAGDALTASAPLIDNILLNLHALTHRDDDDSEDALEGDAVEATNSVDHETDDFWDGEDVAMEDGVDPREGIVSDWNLLAEELIVEAEELGKISISDYDLDILRPFGMKIRNNLTAPSFDEMSYNFSKAGMKNLAKTRSHVWALSRFEAVKFACCINSCICYTGPYASLDECPKCGTSRLDLSGRARRRFSYIPLVPHLCALMSNRTYATQLQYRADEHAKTRKSGTITDIFDGLHYRSLLGERVVVGDRGDP